MDQDRLFEDSGATEKAARESQRDKERHVVFVQEIVKGKMQTKAYRTAGFSKKGAAQGASRLMQDPAIQRAIRHERARLAMLSPDLSVDRLLQELGCIALSDRRDLFDEQGNALKVHELDEPTARAVLSVDVDDVEIVTETRTTKRRSHHVRLGDKRGAIELIAKIKGFMAPEKRDVTVRTLEALVAGDEDVAA